MTLVSIITPSYNSSKFISQTIQSVLNQSLSDWEMIIVDDCSSDNSIEVVNSFVMQDSRIKLIKLFKNSGPAAARNKAIDVAFGRYIAFLDSDDLWLPNSLERRLSFMQETGAVFCYSAYDKVNERGEYVEHVGVPLKVTYLELLKTCSIGCLTAMYDVQYFGKIFMPNISKRQDYGLWLKLLKYVKYGYGLNEVLAQYRLRSDSISVNKLSAAKYTWHLYRDFEKLNLIEASYYFSHYALRGVLRTYAPSLARMLGVLI